MSSAARQAKYRKKPTVKAAAKKYQQEYLARPGVRARVHMQIVASRRLRNTGVTKQMFDDLMVIQDGRCGCCREKLKTPYADHDHEAQIPRGLLCNTCNRIEGLIKARGLTPHGFADRLQQYLDDPPARIAELV